MNLILSILFLASLVAVVRPFKPFTRRSQALVAVVVLLVLIGSVQTGDDLIHAAEQRKLAQEQTQAVQAAPGAGAAAVVAATAVAQPAPSAEPVQPAAPESAWEYGDRKDEMRNKTTKDACVTAENMLHFDFPYGDTVATLCLRNSPAYGKDVILSVGKGQFLCHLDECSVMVKFGDAAPQRFSAVGPSDYSSTALFIHNYPKFIQGLKKADRVIIEAEFYREGRPQIKFNTKNFDATKLESK